MENPIDPDKVAEQPGLLPYAHHVGSAVVKPVNVDIVRSRALSAMEQQTQMQLDQIKEQIDLLAMQAKSIQDRVKVSHWIYSCKMGFKPEINHVYHLYQKADGEYVLSMIGPNQWPSGCKYERFVESVRLLADHTWEIIPL